MDAIERDRVRTQLQAVLDALEAVRPDAAAEPLHTLAGPTRQLTTIRNAVIAAQHNDEPIGAPDLLQRLNQLASVMAGIEYPLGGVHWPRIEAVRKELGALISAIEPG